MKRIGIATLAGALLFATAALAQEDHPQRGDRPRDNPPGHVGGGAPHDMNTAPQRGGNFNYSHPHGFGNSNATGNRGMGNFEEHRVTPFDQASPNRQPRHERGFQDRAFFEGRYGTHERPWREQGRSYGHGYWGGQSYRHDERGFGVRPQNWNERPRNFDRGYYQRNFEAPHRFRFGYYQRPQGWYYRRWSYGEFLPEIFWASEFWIDDWWMFDLPIPPYGYEWVRYGDDVILVNIYTGEILEVIYDVFY